jgi:putative transposase
MCEVLEVSRAGYYSWLKRPPSALATANEGLLAFLKMVAQQLHDIPGYRKLWVEAQVAGFICSKNRVQRLLQRAGYRSCTALKPGHRKVLSGLPVLPNLLNRQFQVDQPNKVWVSDITQIRCSDGWLYVAVVLDLYARRIVGWAAGPVNDAGLVVRALSRAWTVRQANGSELLFHSDQGVQFHSELVLAWLTKRQVTISMSRKGNCWDNACVESFFALMKREWLYRLGELSRSEATVEVEYYIDGFYNEIRRHGTIGMQAPTAFENAA